MSIHDTKEILAKLAKLENEVNALRGREERRCQEAKDFREDINKNKEGVDALFNKIPEKCDKAIENIFKLMAREGGMNLH